MHIHIQNTTISSTDSAGCCESKHPKLGFKHLSDSLFQDQPCQHRVLAARRPLGILDVPWVMGSREIEGVGVRETPSFAVLGIF